MASVSRPATAARAAAPALVVRHGKCRLLLGINGDVYNCRLEPGMAVRGRVWRLKKLTGERKGQVYLAGKVSGTLACSCFDALNTGGRCKHLGALVAAGLLSPRKPRRAERRAAEGGAA